MKLRPVLFLLLALNAYAQTATWIAPGAAYSTADWNNPANWDTGAAPDSGSALALINQSTNNDTVTPIAGGALPIITGGVALAELRFAPPVAGTARLTGLFVGGPNDGDPAGQLQLGGAGLVIQSPGGSSDTYVDVRVRPGSFLDFTNRANLATSGPTVFRLTLWGTTVDPARVRFFGDATAGNNVLRQYNVWSFGPSVFEFHDRASAGTANYFPIGIGGCALFFDQASAGTSTFDFAYGGPANDAFIRFSGAATAGQSVIRSINSQNGAAEFIEQATGGSASVLGLRRVDISGAVTTGGATGRIRAGTPALAPTSVVASDAHTITLSSVYAQDVLLGSNTLEVSSGYIGNLRDSGGAYLSAAGENLVGGRLLKTGPGALTLAGPTFNPADPAHPSYNVISGTTTVRQGSLTLNNRLADVVVETAGTLYGSGIVDGQLTNQGVVRPETAILHVTGDYAQTAAGAFYPYFAYTPGSPTTFGLAIGGQATLAGRLIANTHPNMFSRWQPGAVQIQVLSAASINGRFGTLDTSNNSARVDVSALYTPTTVTLRFEMLPFAAVAVTPGAQALGAYLDQVYHYTGNYFPNNYNWLGDSLTFATNREQVAQTMAILGPDRYGAVLEHGFAAALARRTALDRAVGGNAAGTGGSAVFAEGGRRRLTYAAVDGLPRAASSTDTGLAGGRFQKGAWTFGGYVASEKSDLLLDDAGSTARVDSVEPGAFARFATGNYFVHAGAGFSRDRYALHRVVTLFYGNNARVNHTAAPNGRRTDWSLTAGHTWRGHNWSVSPFAGFVFSRWDIDDFTETTDSTFIRSQLSVAGWFANSRRARAGLEAAGHTLGGRLQPRLTVAWSHEFEQDRSIPASLVGAPAGYLAPGRPAGTDLVQANVALDFHLRRGATLYLSGGGGTGRNTSLTSDFSAGFRWEF